MRNLVEMASLKVPVIAIVIGEGGSGGALGIGIANRIMMLENSTYSVISPEGAAALLWKDSSLAKWLPKLCYIVIMAVLLYKTTQESGQFRYDSR